jgi:hypothetical protein
MYRFAVNIGEPFAEWMVGKTQATSLQQCKANIWPRFCNLVAAALAICNINVLQLNCQPLECNNASSLQTIHAQMACKCHNPTFEVNRMQMNE